MNLKELRNSIKDIKQEAELKCKQLQEQFVSENCPFKKGDKIITETGRVVFFGGIRFDNMFSSSGYIFGYKPNKNGKQSKVEIHLGFWFSDFDISKFEKVED